MKYIVKCQKVSPSDGLHFFALTRCVTKGPC